MAAFEAVAPPVLAETDPEDEPQADAVSERAANESTANRFGPCALLANGETGKGAGRDPE